MNDPIADLEARVAELERLADLHANFEDRLVRVLDARIDELRQRLERELALSDEDEADDA
jgi:hypothetical protein